MQVSCSTVDFNSSAFRRLSIFRIPVFSDISIQRSYTCGAGCCVGWLLPGQIGFLIFFAFFLVFFTSCCSDAVYDVVLCRSLCRVDILVYLGVIFKGDSEAKGQLRGCRLLDLHLLLLSLFQSVYWQTWRVWNSSGGSSLLLFPKRFEAFSARPILLSVDLSSSRWP